MSFVTSIPSDSKHLIEIFMISFINFFVSHFSFDLADKNLNEKNGPASKQLTMTTSTTTNVHTSPSSNSNSSPSSSSPSPTQDPDQDPEDQSDQIQQEESAQTPTEESSEESHQNDSDSPVLENHTSTDSVDEPTKQPTSSVSLKKVWRNLEPSTIRSE